MCSLASSKLKATADAAAIRGRSRYDMADPFSQSQTLLPFRGAVSIDPVIREATMAGQADPASGKRTHSNADEIPA
jgi:hypothetical protein